jgi:chromosome segregation ATPase
MKSRAVEFYSSVVGIISQALLLGRSFKNIGDNMIDIHIPASLEYNTANAKLLATAIKNLHSFDEIAEWNKKAMAEVEALHSILRAIEVKQQTAIRTLSREQQEHEAKPFFTKLFVGRKEQKRWLAEQSRLAREKTQIENVIDQFESAVDFSPDSLDDLKELLEECKQQKKELLTEKKAVNAQMSSIRVEAKQQTANTNYGNYGKGDRRRIRLNEDAALRPQESQKTAIGRQIKELDQIIIWLERFT